MAMTDPERIAEMLRRRYPASGAGGESYPFVVVPPRLSRWRRVVRRLRAARIRIGMWIGGIEDGAQL